MKKHILIAGSILVGVGIMNVIPVKNNEGEILKDDVIVSDVIENKKEGTYYTSTVAKIDQDYTIKNTNSKEKVNNDINEDEKEIIYEKKEESPKQIVYEENSNDVLENLENNEEINKEEDNENNETKITSDIKVNESDISLVSSDSDVLESDNISAEEKPNLSTINLKNGFIEENGFTYYYENDNKVTGIKNIDGIDNYFSPSGKHLGTSKIKVVDVSYYQKDINWEKFKNESDCYGVILRLGFYQTLDKKFIQNLNELKRLNIPYGIYLFSYSTTLSGAKKEANFTNNMISTYDINPTLGIYYDIESWNAKNSSSNEISKDMYNKIVEEYINTVNNYNGGKYKVKVYSGRWYAMNRLGETAKNHVDWVAEYNSTCKYDGAYSMWQYTSNGSVPGIDGRVDISYIAL